MVNIAVGGSKIALLIQGENFQNLFTQASCERTGSADISGTAVALRSCGTSAPQNSGRGTVRVAMGCFRGQYRKARGAGTHRANE
jgi:hypothetical protein